jgi:hypothetical protein
MGGPVPPFPNTPSWCGAQLEGAQGHWHRTQIEWIVSREGKCKLSHKCLLVITEVFVVFPSRSVRLSVYHHK